MLINYVPLSKTFKIFFLWLSFHNKLFLYQVKIITPKIYNLAGHRACRVVKKRKKVSKLKRVLTLILISASMQINSHILIIDNSTSSFEQSTEANVNVNSNNIEDLFKKPFNSNITPVSSNTQTGYYLGHNFQQPFAQVTNFYFSVPKSQTVKLTITDILGKEIAVAVNEFINAGNYKAEFNSSVLSSGVYFYRFESTEHTEIKKMTVVK